MQDISLENDEKCKFNENPVGILRGGVNQYEHFLPLSITISKLQIY
jgi:hypothetical protein